MPSQPQKAPYARLIGWIGAALLRLLGLTWSVRFVGWRKYQEQLDAGGGFLFSLWHEALLPLAFVMRNRDFGMLVSQNKDGEYITQVIGHLGYETIRGSSSRGGYRSLVTMSNLLRQGKHLGITPDGPRGPRRTIQGGALVIAQRGRAPILPIMVASHPRKRLASWDRFMIPWPFAKVVVAIGEPIWIDSDIKPDQLTSRSATKLAEGMTETTRRAALELQSWTGRADTEDLGQ